MKFEKQNFENLMRYQNDELIHKTIQRDNFLVLATVKFNRT